MTAAQTTGGNLSTMENLSFLNNAHREEDQGLGRAEVEALCGDQLRVC